MDPLFMVAGFAVELWHLIPIAIGAGIAAKYVYQGGIQAPETKLIGDDAQAVSKYLWDSAPERREKVLAALGWTKDTIYNWLDKGLYWKVAKKLRQNFLVMNYNMRCVNVYLEEAAEEAGESAAIEDLPEFSDEKFKTSFEKLLMKERQEMTKAEVFRETATHLDTSVKVLLENHALKTFEKLLMPLTGDAGLKDYRDGWAVMDRPDLDLALSTPLMKADKGKFRIRHYNALIKARKEIFDGAKDLMSGREKRKDALEFFREKIREIKRELSRTATGPRVAGNWAVTDEQRNRPGLRDTNIQDVTDLINLFSRLEEDREGNHGLGYTGNLFRDFHRRLYEANKSVREVLKSLGDPDDADAKGWYNSFDAAAAKAQIADIGWKSKGDQESNRFRFALGDHWNKKLFDGATQEYTEMSEYARVVSSNVINAYKQLSILSTVYNDLVEELDVLTQFEEIRDQLDKHPQSYIAIYRMMLYPNRAAVAKLREETGAIVGMLNASATLRKKAFREKKVYIDAAALVLLCAERAGMDKNKALEKLSYAAREEKAVLEARAEHIERLLAKEA